MISINFPGKLTLGMKIIYGIVAVGIIGTIIAVIAFNRSSYLANTMRLVRTQGDVRIVSAGGGSKAAAKNKRFESGDVLVTGVNDSLASVSLDDSKIVTLQADSKAEFVKKNKQIELKLTKGALFFEVVKKLNADETYEIKTSTLTAGIRGTSGYIYYDEQGRDSLTVTDGTVIVTAVNPDTGERKYAEVNGFVVVREYIDRAFSATTDKRPEFQRMIEDSKKKSFGAVIVYQLDRFARNMFDAGYYAKILRDNGAELVSAVEHIAGDSSGVVTTAIILGLVTVLYLRVTKKTSDVY